MRCPICCNKELIFSVENNKVTDIQCIGDCSVPPGSRLFKLLADFYNHEKDFIKGRKRLFDNFMKDLSRMYLDYDRDCIIVLSDIRIEVFKLHCPRWIPSPAGSGYYCTIHNMDVSSCCCPPKESMDYDPYKSGGIPFPYPDE